MIHPQPAPVGLAEPPNGCGGTPSVACVRRGPRSPPPCLLGSRPQVCPPPALATGPPSSGTARLAAGIQPGARRPGSRPTLTGRAAACRFGGAGEGFEPAALAPSGSVRGPSAEGRAKHPPAASPTRPAAEHRPVTSRWTDRQDGGQRLRAQPAAEGRAARLSLLAWRPVPYVSALRATPACAGPRVGSPLVGGRRPPGCRPPGRLAESPAPGGTGGDGCDSGL